MSQSGWATEEGTSRYRHRLEGKVAGDHFRSQQGLWMSSLGIGTYLGNHDLPTDELYRQAVVRTVELGVNVVDSAINYRFQRSERSIGAALKELAGRGIGRSEIVLATKGGFISFDGAPPGDIRSYFQETFIKPGVADFSDFIAGCHCMTPSYLSNQLECSLRNMDVDCIDIYYVHNPETQLDEISRSEFNDRLRKAFEALEGAVSAGKIRSRARHLRHVQRFHPSRAALSQSPCHCWQCIWGPIDRRPAGAPVRPLGPWGYGRSGWYEACHPR